MSILQIKFYVAVLTVTLSLSTCTQIFAEESSETISGKHDYIEYCSDCHGKDGTGNGPKVKQLTTQPKNLTLLSKENGGSFPETVVYQTIDGRRIRTEDNGIRVETIHGMTDMPNWGELFRAIEGDDGAVDEQISRIIDYLESIQVN